MTCCLSNPNPHFPHQTTNIVTVTEIWIDRNFEWESIADLVQPARHDSAHKPLPNSEVNTFNILHRVAVVCNNAHYSPAGLIPDSTADSTAVLARPGAELPLRASLPRTRSDRSTSSQSEYFGNPSEVALLRYFNQLRSIRTVRSAFPVVFEVPFNSANKWHLVITYAEASDSDTEGCAYTLMMKGAPEILLARCSHYLHKVRNGR